MAKPTARPNLGLLNKKLYGLADADSNLHDLRIDLLERNPHQPRTIFDDAKLDELAASIKATGVHQPILARPHPDVPGRYQIAAGERRWRASERAGKEAIPAVVRSLSDAEMATIAVTENLQRQDLDALEEAMAFQTLIGLGLKQMDIAAQLGKSAAYVSLTLKIASLPDALLDELRSDPELRRRVSKEALVEVARAEGEEARLAAWKIAKAGGGSRTVRDAVAADREPPGPLAQTPADPGVAAHRRGRLVEPLLAFRASYGRWSKAFQQVRPEDLGEEDRSVLRSLRDRLNAMDL